MMKSTEIACYYYMLSYDGMRALNIDIFMFSTDMMSWTSAGMGFCERLPMQRDPLFFQCDLTLCASPSYNFTELLVVPLRLMLHISTELNECIHYEHWPKIGLG